MDKFERIIILSVLGIALFLAIDIWQDLHHGGDLIHVGLEMAAFVVACIVIGATALSSQRHINRERDSLRAQITHLSEERDQWKQCAGEYLEGLGKAIDSQFDKWHLTHSEKEVGILLLKGLSHKEVAQLRTTSESTVRQQAASLYAKAKLENKAQLAAFFLDDLFLPKKE